MLGIGERGAISPYWLGRKDVALNRRKCRTPSVRW
jgi:hypothetical protein